MRTHKPFCPVAFGSDFVSILFENGLDLFCNVLAYKHTLTSLLPFHLFTTIV